MIRSARNEIARRMMEGYDETWVMLRRKLEHAQDALDVMSALLTIHGPQAVIDAIATEGRG